MPGDLAAHVFGWSTPAIFEVLRRTLIHGSAAAAQ